MALVAYDDSESDDNVETGPPALVFTKTATEKQTVKQTVKIGLPFNNLVSLENLIGYILLILYSCMCLLCNISS